MLNGRDHRHAAIVRLVKSGRANTQSDLRKALRSDGLAVDQSTLSRDLREIGIKKEGGKYVLASQPSPAPQSINLAASVDSVVPCGPHLVVVRTAVGQAQPVGVAIDDLKESAITATLAGDDTIFVATKNRRSQVVALRRLARLFGEKNEN